MRIPYVPSNFRAIRRTLSTNEIDSFQTSGITLGFSVTPKKARLLTYIAVQNIETRAVLQINICRLTLEILTAVEEIWSCI